MVDRKHPKDLQAEIKAGEVIIDEEDIWAYIKKNTALLNFFMKRLRPTTRSLQFNRHTSFEVSESLLHELADMIMAVKNSKIRSYSFS